MSLLEITATYLHVAVPYTANSKCKHFEIEGIPPSLAIGATTMCKELLCVKRGEKADFKFILGHPSLRPTWTAEYKAAFLLLFEETGYDQTPVSLKKMGLSLQTLQEFRFPLPMLLTMGFAPKDVFLTALRSKIDYKVCKKDRKPMRIALLNSLIFSSSNNRRLPLSIAKVKA